MNETEIQRSFFHPICNQDEIERVFNVQNSVDYLLKLRAKTIVDHMRLFRVYRNKALLDEKNWSLERSFDDSHYKRRHGCQAYTVDRDAISITDF